jgi:hypothetical protein
MDPSRSYGHLNAIRLKSGKCSYRENSKKTDRCTQLEVIFLKGFEPRIILSFSKSCARWCLLVFFPLKDFNSLSKAQLASDHPCYIYHFKGLYISYTNPKTVLRNIAPSIFYDFLKFRIFEGSYSGNHGS